MILVRVLIAILSFDHAVSIPMLWPNCTVAYSISPDLNADQKELIFQCMSVLEGQSCIRFVPVRKSDTISGYLQIVLSKSLDGCWSSHTGYSGRRQILSLENDACFDRSIILHELMHVLGFLHEHNRPDRDDHLLIRLDRVIPEKRDAFQKRSYSDLNPSDFMTDYDPYSIMHYSETAFSLDFEPTMISKHGHRLGGVDLSPIDVYRLNRLCNGPKKWSR